MCKQIIAGPGVIPDSVSTFATQAECLQSCGLGACCYGEGSVVCRLTTYSDCGRPGELFLGVGTACIPNPCNPLP